MGVGPWQLAVVVLLVLLLFGASRLGEIGRGLGEGVRAFRKSMKDGERRRGSTAELPDDEEDEEEETEARAPERLRKKPRRGGHDDAAVQNKRHVRAKRSTRAEEEDEGS